MEKLKIIAEWFQKHGITLYIVGGACRDELMGLPIEDVDVCIVGGETAKDVENRLNECIFLAMVDDYTSVHGSFPIWIVEIDGVKYEFAMARKERLVGQTRQEFECEVNNVTIEEDLERRDLTINAIAKNIVTGELVDPFEGAFDIKHKILTPTSEAFKEDALRVYRAARFAAIYPDFTVTFKLKLYAKHCDYMQVSNERVGIELMKMFKKAKKPSRFFKFLRDICWLKYHFKEVYDLIGVPQSPIHHPEGDCYTHTMHCINAANGWFYRAVMLCHDLGKATTTTINGFPISSGLINDDTLKGNLLSGELKVKAIGHEKAGVPLTKSLLQRISFCSHKEIQKIACLVELHMLRGSINDKNYDKMVRRTLRKLMRYGLTWESIFHVTYYDLSGRPPRPVPSATVLTKELYWNHANELVRNGEMEPIVTGDELVNMGMEPGPEMGKIIKHALELQDRGTLRKDNWIKVLASAGYQFFRNIKTITNESSDISQDNRGE